MSLRVSFVKLIRRHNIYRISFTNIPKSCITNKRYFSAQDKDDTKTPRQPRKLVISPTQSSALSEDIPSGYTDKDIQSETIHKSTHFRPSEQDNASDNTQHSESQETHDTKTKPKSTDSRSSSKVKLTSQQYAYNILNDEILDAPKKPHEKYDMNALSEEEKKLYKAVQHLINEGFIDSMELHDLLGDKHRAIEKQTNDTFHKYEQADEQKSQSFDMDEEGLRQWRQRAIQEMDNDAVQNFTMKEPLRIKYRNYDHSDGDVAPDAYYELFLDARDLKHILLYLIYNELHTKRFYELNPSIKELAFLLYGIRTQGEFNRLLSVMSRTRKQIVNMLQSYPRQSTPNILPTYDTIHDLSNTDNEDKYGYDEYGQNVEQQERNMTSFELDTTIKRVQDLEFRQFGYTQAQAQAYDDTDEFINIVQNEDEAEAETAQSAQEIKEELAEDEVDTKRRSGYYNSVMEKVQERWSGDLMDMKYVGGDWRVRLGIAERAIGDDLDVESEVEAQYRRQLNESIAYTTRKRYKISPWTIRSLPYAEAKELNIDFTNVKLLNKFVNDRGMILPRRFTGVDKKTQKRIAKAIKRARKIGFVGHMSKLLMVDKDGIKKKQRELEMKKFIQRESDEYDMMNATDLQAIYPEYAHAPMAKQERSELEMDFDREYEIDEEELFYQNQLRKQQNIFMRQIKQDIVKKIPEYWQKRLSFRDKSNQLVNGIESRNNSKQNSQRQ